MAWLGADHDAPIIANLNHWRLANDWPTMMPSHRPVTAWSRAARWIRVAAVLVKCIVAAVLVKSPAALRGWSRNGPAASPTRHSKPCVAKAPGPPWVKARRGRTMRRTCFRLRVVLPPCADAEVIMIRCGLGSPGDRPRRRVRGGQDSQVGTPARPAGQVANLIFF
jgi:hypothetical protein